MSPIYDITLPITDGMVVFPGDPTVEIRPHSRIAEGEDANVTRLSLGSHTGTHLDAARHFVEGGQAVDALPLERLIGPARVVEVPESVTAIGAEALRAAGIEGERRVLLKTRGSAFLGASEFRRDYAHLTGDGAEYLLSQSVELVGIDYLSIEAFDAEEPVAHQALLAREVIIVEGLDLRAVPPGRYELLCLPIKLADLDGAPVRAVLRPLPG
jgi:arylformamidase